MNRVLYVILNIIGLIVTVTIFDIIIGSILGVNNVSYVIELIVAFGTGLFWPWNIFSKPRNRN